MIYVLEIFEHCRNFKYTIGDKLKNELVDMMICIYLANKRREKAPLLVKAQDMEVIRLPKDLQQLNLKTFADLSSKVENISKQLAGWLKSVR